MGDEKYLKLGIKNPYEDKDAMDKDKCDKLYEMFIKDFKWLKSFFVGCLQNNDICVNLFIDLEGC